MSAPKKTLQYYHLKKLRIPLIIENFFILTSIRAKKIKFWYHHRNHLWEDPFESNPSDGAQKHNAALTYKLKRSSNMFLRANGWAIFEWIFSYMIAMMTLKTILNHWAPTQLLSHIEATKQPQPPPKFISVPLPTNKQINHPTFLKRSPWKFLDKEIIIIRW